MKAALLRYTDKAAIATLASFALLCSASAVQAQDSAQGVTVAMRIVSSEPTAPALHTTPSSHKTQNVTVVPKTSKGEADAAQQADHLVQTEAAEAVTETPNPKSYALSGDARQGIESTVRDQLKALASGNADTAFANLSPQTQRYFADPSRFMQRVATEAAPIVKTKSFAFLDIEQTHGEALQQVLLTDEDGRSWLAKFNVEQMLSGDWKVKACVLESVPGQQA